MFSMIYPGNKKGIFFTLIALLLLSIVLFSFGETYSYSLQEKSSVIDSRVNNMNQFINDIDDDMINAIYISGYRSMVALTDYVVSNGTFVSNATQALKDFFLYGTINNQTSVFMENNTFMDWIDSMADRADDLGITMNIYVSYVNISHTSPWSVRFSVVSDLELNDSKSAASWSRQKSLSADISIINFEDPGYAAHTSGLIVKRIRQSPYDGNFSSGNDTSNLMDHVFNTYYIAFNASPSFLMRFEGDDSASVYGIESLVNKTEIMDYCSISTSSVDSICWGQDSSKTTWRVQGMTGTNFKIDNETNSEGVGRISRYGLEDVIY